MGKPMKPVDFFARYPVFRHDEFVAVHAGAGKRSPLTSASVLKQHVAAGHLLHVRRGLYASVPRGVSPEKVQVDPYLVVTKLVEGAVVAYHAALQFHGKTYSVWRRFHYPTSRWNINCFTTNQRCFYWYYASRILCCCFYHCH